MVWKWQVLPVNKGLVGVGSRIKGCWSSGVIHQSIENSSRYFRTGFGCVVQRASIKNACSLGWPRLVDVTPYPHAIIVSEFPCLHRWSCCFGGGERIVELNRIEYDKELINESKLSFVYAGEKLNLDSWKLRWLWRVHNASHFLAWEIAINSPPSLDSRRYCENGSRDRYSKSRGRWIVHKECAIHTEVICILCA